MWDYREFIAYDPELCMAYNAYLLNNRVLSQTVWGSEPPKPESPFLTPGFFPEKSPGRVAMTPSLQLKQEAEPNGMTRCYLVPPKEEK